MLGKISWSNYLEAVALLIAGYYVVIGILYYRAEIKQILNGKFKRKQKISGDDTAPGEMEAADFDELEAVVADLKNDVLEQAGKEATKDQLLLQLQQRLANYGGLRRPAYRVAINHFIIEKAKDICGVAYSEDELEAAWRKLPR